MWLGDDNALAATTNPTKLQRCVFHRSTYFVQEKLVQLLALSIMSAAKIAADVFHKGAVLGLMSLFGYQAYQIGYNVSEKKRVDTQYHHTDSFKKMEAKVEEEARLKDGIDKIPDVYDREDNSYLKRVPNLQKPSGK